MIYNITTKIDKCSFCTNKAEYTRVKSFIGLKTYFLCEKCRLVEIKTANKKTAIAELRKRI